MKSNLIFSFGLHALFFTALILGRMSSSRFEGYPVIMPVELVTIEPVSFKTPDVEKIAPRKQEVEPQPKPLEGVTVETKKLVKDEPEERPLQQDEEKPKESEQGTATLSGEDIQLDVVEFPFTYYLAIIRSRIQTNWEPPVHPSRRALSKRTVVRFRIQRSGQITDISVAQGSGDYLYDQSCVRAVTLANPLPPLPFDFPRKSLGVGFAFKQGF